MIFAMFLTGVQWGYTFVGSAAVLYILYKLLPVIIALFSKKIAGK